MTDTGQRWSSALEHAMTGEELASVVGAWSLETFGPRERFEGHVRHLERELDELLRAVERRDTVAMAKEAADVAILLMGLAPRAGFDLIAAVRAKMAQNVCREWGPPDAQGVIEHVRVAQEDQDTENNVILGAYLSGETAG